MPLGDQKCPCDVIVVGRGAAAADYLLTLPRRYRSIHDDSPLPMTIFVIGEADPWGGPRGYVKGAYAQYVNQEKAVLQRRRGDEAPTEQGPQDRLGFARESEEIIRECSDRVIEGTVHRVAPLPKCRLADRGIFKVESSAGELYAHRIVFATGAGIEGDKGHRDYHAIPEEVTRAWPSGPPAAVMNLDRFIKLTEATPLGGKKVAVLGPTAGTDAVMNALTVRVPPDNLYWLMRGQASTRGFDNVYPGASPAEKQSIKRAMDTAKRGIIAYEAGSLALANATAGKIKVTCSQTNVEDKDPLMGKKVAREFRTLEVDYFVFSVGQTASNTLTAPPVDPKAAARKILDASLLSRLEPVYDINQRHGSTPWEHVTAVQLEGSDSMEGLMIIGAAAFQMTATMDHSFLQYEYDKLRDELQWWTTFNVCARDHFRELIEPRKLRDMLIPAVEVCQAKDQAFRIALKDRIREQLDKFGFESPKEGIKARVQRMVRKAEYLCYLFMQRRMAADYLYGGTAEQVKGRSVQSLLNPTRNLPASLGDCRLLAAVNANIGALNASSPQHLQKKTVIDPLGVGQIHANYLEDQTELRCYIAAHYPSIEEPSAQWFIKKVAGDRKQLGNMGFDKGKIFEYERLLQRMDDNTRTFRQGW